jgi:hypothetical protein
LYVVCFSTVLINIKVVFEKQTILKEDAVKGLPEYIRERALKLVNNKQESTMTIQGTKFIMKCTRERRS